MESIQSTPQSLENNGRNEQYRGILSVEEFADLEANAEESQHDQYLFAERLENEGEQRLSPEYITEAAEAFKEVLTALDALLETEGMQLEEVNTIVALDTGARYIGHIMRAAMMHLRTMYNQDGTVDLVFMPTDKFTTEVQQQQFKDEAYDFLMHRSLADGPVVVIDDLLHAGGSLRQAKAVLEQVVESNRIVGVVLGATEEESLESDPGFPTVVMQNNQELSRWFSRPEEGNDLPEHHPRPVYKHNHTIFSNKHLSAAEHQLLQADRVSAKQIGQSAMRQFILMS